MPPVIACSSRLQATYARFTLTQARDSIRVSETRGAQYVV
jgi:hypothetical protein